MSRLSIQQVLAVTNDREIIKIATPEWGGEVWLRPYDGNDRDWYDQMRSKKLFPPKVDGQAAAEADWSGLRAISVARAWCDEKGSREPITEEQVLALSKRSGAALDRCFAALSKASGLGATAEDDAAKNSKPAPNGGTGTN